MVKLHDYVSAVATIHIRNSFILKFFFSLTSIHVDLGAQDSINIYMHVITA
jgi:hypothetical protein